MSKGDWPRCHSTKFVVSIRSLHSLQETGPHLARRGVDNSVGLFPRVFGIGATLGAYEITALLTR